MYRGNVFCCTTGIRHVPTVLQGQWSEPLEKCWFIFLLASSRGQVRNFIFLVEIFISDPNLSVILCSLFFLHGFKKFLRKKMLVFSHTFAFFVLLKKNYLVSLEISPEKVFLIFLLKFRFSCFAVKPSRSFFIQSFNLFFFFFWKLSKMFKHEKTQWYFSRIVFV